MAKAALIFEDTDKGVKLSVDLSMGETAEEYEARMKDATVRDLSDAQKLAGVCGQLVKDFVRQLYERGLHEFTGFNPGSAGDSGSTEDAPETKH